VILSVASPRPRVNCRANVPTARSRVSHWAFSPARTDRSARMVTVSASMSMSMLSGSTPGRSIWAMNSSPSRNRSIGMPTDAGVRVTSPSRRSISRKGSNVLRAMRASPLVSNVEFLVPSIIHAFPVRSS